MYPNIHRRLLRSRRMSIGLPVMMMLCFLPGEHLLVQAQGCADAEMQTTGTHSFRRALEIFEIPITQVRSSNDAAAATSQEVVVCQPVALEVRWANGRNNGTNLHVTFLDSAGQTIYTKEISAFVNGRVEFPFETMENQRWVRSGSVMMTVTSVSSMPQSVAIQAVQPFALPASISYRVTRVAVRRRLANKRSDKESSDGSGVEGKG
jgi:hypothetical protein